MRVSPDGRWLVACTAVPATIYVFDLDTKQLVSERRLFDGAFNPGIPAMTKDSQLLVMPHAVNREFSVTAANDRHRLGHRQPDLKAAVAGW